MQENTEIHDIFVIGGGINGCGIARDACGRGYSVALAEMNDLASATSSSSTKLFHGGLRYLEFFEFRLVREALIEREILYTNMPHISWPMRFVLPVFDGMRFESSTPTSRLLTAVMPWLKGRRPAWLIRLGLFLYDHLGGRKLLPATRTLDLRSDPAGKPLQGKYRKAYEYSDCWVDDARLVVLNARDAASRGARIMTRSKVTGAECREGVWQVTLQTPDGTQEMRARMLVNAAGPWVVDIADNKAKLDRKAGIRLVRGSHIVTRRLFDHDRAYFFQGTDGRIIFAIPYEGEFTLIGTTDADHADATQKPVCTDEEARYLCDFASRYFERPVTMDDIVWRYSGVRPLYDDGASSATAATRDYVLRTDTSRGAPVLNVFGGKITTYRRLAESALEQIDEALGRQSTSWTEGAPLPGGDFPVSEKSARLERLVAEMSFLDRSHVERLFRQYGSEAEAMLAGAGSLKDLGGEIAEGVTAREIDWSIEHEWTVSAEDFLWRRTKLGLHLSSDGKMAVSDYIEERVSDAGTQGINSR